MATVATLWDQYDEALERCLDRTGPGGDARQRNVRQLARAAAALISCGELTEAHALYEAGENGLTGDQLRDLAGTLADLL
jgi:hypothetical protein